VRRLSPEERAHYEWLVRGLLDGARRLVAHPGRESTIRLALDQVEELFLEVEALVSEEPLFDEAADLERRMIEELVADEPPQGIRIPERSSPASQ